MINTICDINLTSPGLFAGNRVSRGIFGSKVCLAIQQLLLQRLDLVEQSSTNSTGHFLVHSSSAEDHLPTNHGFNPGDHAGGKERLMSVGSPTDKT